MERPDNGNTAMIGVKQEGKPCIRCGCTLRYIKDKGCVQCRQTKSMYRQRSYRDETKNLKALLSEALLCIKWDEEPELVGKIRTVVESES
jgi:hypothetical protein